MKSCRALGGLLLMLLMALWGATTTAQPTYTPPSHVTVRMYRLFSPAENAPQAGEIFIPVELCTWASMEYGCTAHVGEWSHRYPYGFENPVTVPIETDYLLDVVAQEMGTLNLHPTARHAQAIAARSYAYHRQYFDALTSTPPMNNSTEAQVFIPYRWQVWDDEYYPTLNSADPCRWRQDELTPQQRAVCAAVNASQNYITGPNHLYDLPETPLFASNAPAFAKFFQDTPNATLTEPSVVPGTVPPRPVYPYLVGVVDPISSDPAIPVLGHRHGMSQHGASRWAYGNTIWQGTLAPWSVQWDTAEQILAHYYTGIQIRDQAGHPVMADDRWNPLRIDWGTADQRPPQMQHGASYPITVELQNTGTAAWACNFPSEDYRLVYRWTRNDNQTYGTDQRTVCGLVPGEASAPLTLTIQDIPDWGAGAYGLHLDIESVNGLSRLWLTYTRVVCIGPDPCRTALLPVVAKPLTLQIAETP